MKWLTGDLAELSSGSGRRAAVVLVVVHLAAGLTVWPLWAIGLLPIFDDVHWIPATIAVVVATVATLGLFLRFGFWGTARTMGRGGGEDYESTFAPRTAFALGWLRWFMQIVLVFIILVPTYFTVANVRWWHVFGTDELDHMSELAATIPVPSDWTLIDTEATETGIPGFMDGPVGADPEGSVESRYEVPSSYTFDDLKQWLESPEWQDPSEGDAFGAVQRQQCESEYTRCTVRLVPPAGQEPEFFVRVIFDEASYDGDVSEVRVRLNYRKFVEPDWDVSRQTVDRAAMIPIPSDWVRSSIVEEKTNSGDSFSQFYGVPEDFTREDLEAWLDSGVWTDPVEGPPFGEIRRDSPCQLTGPDDRPLCSAIVVDTERSPSGPSADGPIESLSVSLSADHTVRVGFERNG